MTLRVTIVTQNEPFYIPEFFGTFFRELPDVAQIDSVVTMNALDDSLPELVSRMYNFYGPKNMFVRTLQFAVRRAASFVGGPYSVESVVRREGIPVEQRETVNDPSFIASLEENETDVLLSVSAPEIFERAVLDTPEWGCINVHTASLPDYRGMLPTFWALYHGEDEIGLTVHTMADEVDRGEIVRQTSFKVRDGDTLDDVILRGKRRGGMLTAEALGDIATGSVDLKPMEGSGSYFSFPTANDRRELQRRGWELL